MIHHSLSRAIKFTVAVMAIAGFSRTAQATFVCGPNTLTYDVISNWGAAGHGVRCVKIERESSNPEYRVSWYGEGYWGATKYRHFGHYGYDMDTMTYHVFAADIYGNGEDVAGRTNNLTLTKEGAPLAPYRIVVTGDWNETWTLMGDGLNPNYTSVLGPLEVCGPHFTEMRVIAANGNFEPDFGRPGRGVRCVLEHNQPLWEVLGSGYWGSDPSRGRYLHIITSDSLNESHGWDICDPSHADFCGNQELRIWSLGIGTPSPYLYAYGWGENWYVNHRAD